MTQRVFPVRYEWPRLAALLGLAVGLWLLGRCAPEGVAGLAAKVGLWLLAPLAAWHSGLVSAAEKVAARELAAVLARLPRRAAEKADADTGLAPLASGERGW
jgi:hypothetical protein